MLASAGEARRVFGEREHQRALRAETLPQRGRSQTRFRRDVGQRAVLCPGAPRAVDTHGEGGFFAPPAAPGEPAGVARARSRLLSTPVAPADAQMGFDGVGCAAGALPDASAPFRLTNLERNAGLCSEREIDGD
jgi:hypothetical protein